MPRIRVNDVDLFYEVTGEGWGEPLVLVHGAWSDHHIWDAVVPALVGASFRVLTYDRRGHGQSAHPPGQWSVRDEVADLASLIVATGFAPAHIAGNSFGASLVLRLAQSRPDLFRTLIAHEPALMMLLAQDPANARLVGAMGEHIRSIIERLLAGDTAGGAREFIENLAFKPGAWEQLPPEVRQTFTKHALSFLAEVNEPDATTIELAPLADFDRPALLTQGEQSPPVLTRVLDIVAGAMPRAYRLTFSGSGHLPHVTHPSQYVQVVSRFVSAASGRVEEAPPLG